MKAVHYVKQYSNNLNELSDYLQNNTLEVFSDGTIADQYRILKTIEFSDSNTKLIKAWMALFSGDNLTMVVLSKQIEKDKLSERFLGFYYDLLALGSSLGSILERMEYSDKAIEHLKNKEDFFLANAYLTRGQLLNGQEKFRDAASYYIKSYDLFLKFESYFPAIVGLTNGLLNYFRIGEFEKLNSLYNQAMLTTSVLQTESAQYYDVLSLPFGMYLFTIGKANAALSNLNKAYEAIKNLKLIHMHGYIEMYLLEVFNFQDETLKTETFYNQIVSLFQGMNYPMMKVIIIFGKLLLNREISNSEIEMLESFFEQEKVLKNPLLFEILTILFLKQKSNIINGDIIINRIKHYRYTGDIIYLSQALLLLAEYYWLNNDLKACTSIIKEYIEIYDNYNILSPLYKYKYSFWDIIKKLKPDIRPKSSSQQILTQKELEIIRLIANGYSNQDIASQLFVTIGTVKWHANNIFSKLNAKNRLEAVKIAKKKKII